MKAYGWDATTRISFRGTRQCGLDRKPGRGRIRGVRAMRKVARTKGRAEAQVQAEIERISRGGRMR
jgi:hypothetical protein